MDLLLWLLDARLSVAGSTVLWREVVGNEFWLIWIAVDAVGVPLLLTSGFYPSAVMYLVYGGFCVWGFLAWLRTSRAIRRVGEPAPAYSEAVA